MAGKMAAVITVNCERCWFADPPSGDILGAARVVCSVCEGRLADDEVALARDDVVNLQGNVDLDAILQPKHLTQKLSYS